MSSPEHWLLPDWPAPANVRAASTLRGGGVSTGPYASLNLAGHVGDDPGAVSANRARLKSWLELPSAPFWLEQTHGNRALYAHPGQQDRAADASHTDQAGVVCAVLTADCLPVLACTDDGRQVAAIHAGWRGLEAGVIANALAGFDPRRTLVWLGPAIGLGRFEVGAEVRAAFVHQLPAYADAFTAHADGKWLADIYQLATIALARLGVRQVFGGGLCTVSDRRRFFSYRRDRQTGRMASLIWRT